MCYNRASMKKDVPALADWSLQLFRLSLLKQAKWRAIVRMLEAVEYQSGLDIGGDNGVISLLLRRRGGVWTSADGSAPAVAAIRRLVGDRVVTVEGHRLPLPDGQFDVVVIIDYLEHVIEDEAFIAECHRVLKPHGTLIVNTPHLKRSPLHALRRVLGLTDTRHGHVRPGYTANQLFRTLKNGFDVQDVCTYSRCFSQLLDTGIRWISERRGGDHDAVKGTVIGEAEFRRLGKLVRLYRVLYPLLWLAVQLDRLMFFTQGFMLIVRARRRNWIPRAATPVLRDGRSLAEATLGGRIGSAAL